MFWLKTHACTHTHIFYSLSFSFALSLSLTFSPYYLCPLSHTHTPSHPSISVPASSLSFPSRSLCPLFAHPLTPGLSSSSLMSHIEMASGEGLCYQADGTHPLALWRWTSVIPHSAFADSRLLFYHVQSKRVNKQSNNTCPLREIRWRRSSRSVLAAK